MLQQTISPAPCSSSNFISSLGSPAQQTDMKKKRQVDKYNYGILQSIKFKQPSYLNLFWTVEICCVFEAYCSIYERETMFLNGIK